MLTVDDVVKAVPAHLKSDVSQNMVDELNHLSSDPLHAETMRNNFISYTKVMSEGKFKLLDYVNAVKYVSYRIMGYSKRESYSRTFPLRYQTLVAKGMTDKDISAYVSAYNKNKLVNLIMEQSLVPSWILNQEIYQNAINTQAELMMGARSEKVRSDAANSILTHLKKPESKQIELSIGVKDTSGMDELRTKLREMAEMQQNLIENGMTTQQIAHQPIIDAEIVGDSDAD